MTSSGIHQVPNDHRANVNPSVKLAVPAITGMVLGRARSFAPARTLMAVAPIRIQYGGPRVAGVTGTVSHRSRISATTIRYSSSPTHHSAAAAGASSPAWPGQAGIRTAAAMDRDWVATIHSSQLPLMSPRTESLARVSSRLAGTP